MAIKASMVLFSRLSSITARSVFTVRPIKISSKELLIALLFKSEITIC